ncbi:acyl-CoA-binding domain-containing protein 4 isoform X2 [Cynoglossus semilaevis]|uniref:Acyl-CoA binding domain containing 4 n=2 Tax=Cynoglossus semilaevis TaxID=244447 RepID=A0A3P8UMX6_CYNSE|nr:acyl-CoA-binding domain-containing protein 4 isoform X2 [Cynoglossus semilaevis]
MPVPATDGPAVDHQKRFQAAVDVIQNLPKNGLYSPSYEVMLRFYSLYKQAVCGTCKAPRPGFWDPVGRYKWDAWSRLGAMSSESAMTAYVEEMKKVAQEVIDTMPMNEKTASLLHHFEPLYLVIDDMPRPPQTLLTLREGLKSDRSAQMKKDEEEQQQLGEEEEEEAQTGASTPPGDQEMKTAEVMEVTAEPVHQDSGVSECLALTSDSETEIFCDSVDSVEQLSSIRVPAVKSNGFPNGQVLLESSGLQDARQVGAGQGGEGGSDGKGQGRVSRRRDGGRGDPHHGWRERGVPQGGPGWGVPGGGGGGAGRGGGDGSEGGVERLHDIQLQQQIMVALRRLREDMRSVMERLEVVERLAATHVDGSWGTCLQCSAARQKEDRWWPFDVSAQTLLLFLVWPFVAQGVVTMVRKAQKRSRSFS